MVKNGPKQKKKGLASKWKGAMLFFICNILIQGLEFISTLILKYCQGEI